MFDHVSMFSAAKLGYRVLDTFSSDASFMLNLRYTTFQLSRLIFRNCQKIFTNKGG